MVEFIFHIFLISSIAYFGYSKSKYNSIGHFFIPALVMKIVAGVAVGGLYTYYYKYGDTLLYFEDAKVLANLFYSDWRSYLEFIINGADVRLHYNDNPRALFFVKLISPLAIITNNNYWLTTVYLSIASFFASWYFVLTVQKHYFNLLNGAIVGFLFFPSVVFWSSGLVKESIAMVSLAVLFSFFIQLINDCELGWKKIIIGIVLSWLLFQIKYYYVAAFVLAISPTLILKYIQWRIKIRHTTFSWIILLLLVGLGVSMLHPNLSLNRFIDVIVENNRLYDNHIDLAKTIQYYNLQNTIISVIINSPIAFFSILFRPLIFETVSWLQVVLSFENMLIMTMLVISIVKLRTVNIKITPILISCLVYIFVLCVFLGLSTPNFGSLSRYRISFLPILIMLLSYNSPIFNWVKVINLKFKPQKS